MILRMEEKSPSYSVSALTALVKSLVEGSLPPLSVEGELSNFRPNPGGHLYFTLKDEGAQIGAVMFRGKASALTFRPRDGMKVRASGSVQVYAPQGRYQLVISRMEVAGEGDILRVIEERRRRLAAEGLFGEERKKPLPEFPRTVGVVTSATGAAVRDVLNVARRRNPGVNVVVLPALVQGDGAAEAVARQIRTANEFSLCDVLIVGRGGGSLEDLLPFSEEAVVRALAESRIPTVSAVGHEIDWSLADYAADVRAPTPSAAAELVFPLRSEIADEIRSLADSMEAAVSQVLREARVSVRSFDRGSMEARLGSLVAPLSARLASARRSLGDGIAARTADMRGRLERAARTLEVGSPESILRRGYAVVRTEGGAVARSPGDVAVGSKIEITLSGGTISAERKA